MAGIDYIQPYNTALGGQNVNNNVQNTRVTTPIQTTAPQLLQLKPGQNIFATPSVDTYQPTLELQQQQKTSELNTLDKFFKFFGINQPQLVQKAIEINPRITELCRKNGFTGKVDQQNIKDTENHVNATASFAVMIGEFLGFGDDDLKTLNNAAKVHDIGKALMPREILDKPGKLTDDERKIMALHSEVGSEILKTLEYDNLTIEVAGAHHDGYNPFETGRAAKMSNVVKVADIYSALIEPRSYKAAMSNDKAFAIMDDMANKGEISPEALSALKEGVSQQMAA